MKTSYYFDHAATTPTDPRVLEAMAPYLSDRYFNPSSLYRAARETRTALETARSRVAKVLGAKPTEIVWISGGTESVNLAIQGVLGAHPGSHWVTDAIEHDAVLSLRGPMERQGHTVATVGVDRHGLVKVEEVMGAVGEETVLISVMMANNEIGTIQPVMELAKAVAQVRAERIRSGNPMPLYLHTDACQAAGYLDLSVTRLGVDLLSLNGSKLYGPKGSGILYVRFGTELEPLIYGGGQERGRRSGTESVAQAVGLAEALGRAQQLRLSESQRQRQLRDELLAKLQAAIPGLLVNGSLKQRLPNNLNLTLPGLDGETLVLYLDEAGIMASTGSACSSSDEAPSHVLLAIGRDTHEAASSLRLTLGRETDQAAVDHVVKVLPEVAARLRDQTT